ncbi:hypothetical protein CF327_g5267 [Tilletia walkeri]|uniref:Acid phosphatase n=2 Tax=Tilletia TaxID=13289 RepID=A0A8X7T4Q1_9BASI|nr:hypothetical protein CF327_g5267 [Tilletia walkeri]KAE8254009.1 hypothetical protein A4X13_0g3577 [Tilletia indica]KAE8268048.1 hypothetical protein A4X09_0g4296 [Tilletia walkeri]
MSGAAGSSSGATSSSAAAPGMEGHPHPVPLFADGSSTFPSPIPSYGGGSTASSPDLGWTAPPPDANLELAQVHFFVRHGERTPVRVRLETSNPPIPGRWNLCHGSAYVRANVLQLSRGQPVVEEMPVRRILEAKPSKLVPDTPFNGECLPGELTNLGRMSGYEIGQKLRALYADRLHFLPESISAKDHGLFMFRSTNMSRTVETCQQIVAGLLPSQARLADSASSAFVPRIHVRNFLSETLIPNTHGCSRFRQLDKDYAEKAAVTYNSSLESLDASLSPHNDGQPIRVDGHPRLSGLLDTIRAAQAHGFPVPDAFVVPKTIELANKAILAEWFSGYNDPDPQRALEFRRLSMGRLFSELQTRLDSKAKQPEKDSLRLGIYSTHDTTLAGILCTLDAFDNQWPAFAATLNFELFRRPERSDTANSSASSPVSGLLSRLGLKDKPVKDEHYVRVRYGAKTLRLPACAAAGQHLDGHAEFCTLDAFRQVVDSLQHPEGLSWEAECEAGAKQKRSSK